MAKSSSNKWAFGAIMAGVAGFLAGVLTAPKSGKDTRKDIKNVALKARTEAEKNLKALHSELNHKIDEAKVTGEKMSGKAKSEYEDILDKAKQDRIILKLKDCRNTRKKVAEEEGLHPATLSYWIRKNLIPM